MNSRRQSKFFFFHEIRSTEHIVIEYRRMKLLQTHIAFIMIRHLDSSARSTDNSIHNVFDTFTENENHDTLRITKWSRKRWIPYITEITCSFFNTKIFYHWSCTFCFRNPTYISMLYFNVKEKFHDFTKHDVNTSFFDLIWRLSRSAIFDLWIWMI